MDQNVLYFFDGKPRALPLYETFEDLISGAEEIDDELMGWVKEAAVFSAGKR